MMNDYQTMFVSSTTLKTVFSSAYPRPVPPSLDGIVIGDIGPKYGYPSMENGYMLFNHLRITHSALLAKYNTVNSETGEYKKIGHPQVVPKSLWTSLLIQLHRLSQGMYS
jgi:hypothetical protein